MKTRYSNTPVALALVLSISAAQTMAQGVGAFDRGQGLQLDCVQPIPSSLECNYRLARPAPVTNVDAVVGDVELPKPRVVPAQTIEGQHAVLFLVDTSDPARQTTVATVTEHIRRLATAAQPHHRLGLATFDTELQLRSALGSTPDAVITAAAEMQAVGRTTELYRNTLEAIHLLAAFPARRRALFIFSDGLAEDQAYFHRDVVAAAHEAGVVIFGVGYPRSVSLSVALQTLRRMSDETDGRFVPANQKQELPAEFFADPYAVLDNGGRVSLDLQPAIDAGLAGQQTVRVSLTTEHGTATTAVPTELPTPLPPPPTVVIEAPAPPVQAEIPPPKPAPTPIQRPTPPAVPAGFSMTHALLLGGGVLLILVIAVLLLRKRKQPEEVPQVATETSSEEPPRTYAFLEMADGSKTRHAINTAAYRMGRHSDNELPLVDPSISRHHAEIYRRRDGSFTVADLDSMNGIFVNDERVKTATLSEGDLLELGDIGMRFIVNREDDLPGEQTVMLRTVAPKDVA